MVRAQRRKFHYIYKTTCLITGKWYIGMHSTDDLNDGYRGSGTHLARSVKKHGKENHACEILEFCEDRESLARREEELVTEELKSDPMCMNIARGGLGNIPGYVPPEQSRIKNSIASTLMWEKRRAEGYVSPPPKPEHVAKRAAANTGKKRNDAQKQNLAAGQEQYYATADKDVLKQRGQKSAATRKQNGTNRGGRPKGIPMRKASCIHCKKETIVSAIVQFHGKCNANI